MPRPPNEFEISINLLTPIDKLKTETRSMLTSTGILNNKARFMKEII